MMDDPLSKPIRGAHDAEQDEALHKQSDRADWQAEQIRALLVGQEQLTKQMAEIVVAHHEIVRRHNEDLIRVGRMERTISETALVLADVREIVGTVAALKGGLRVLGWLGSAAKWIATLVAGAALVLAGLKFLIASGDLPLPPK